MSGIEINGRKTREKNSLWSGQLPRHLQLAGLHRHPFRGNFPQDLEDATVDSPRERFAGTAERAGGSIERSGRCVWRGIGAANGMGWVRSLVAAAEGDCAPRAGRGWGSPAVPAAPPAAAGWGTLAGKPSSGAWRSWGYSTALGRPWAGHALRPDVICSAFF